MTPEQLMKIFGTIDPEEIEKILKGKEGSKQQKVVSSSSPKTVKISAEECKSLCKKAGLTYLEGYESRVVEHVISDETPDRDGDILRAKGADFTNYQKNPVILFVHNSRTFNVGTSIKQWVQGKKVLSWGLYYDERLDPEGIADKVFRYVSNGAMKGNSVGFLPLKGGVNRPGSKEEREKLGLGDWGVEFLKWEVLEYSPCPVPCNPNALRRMIKDGSFKNEDFSFLLNENMLPESIVKTAMDLGYKTLLKDIESLVDDINENPEENIKVTFKDADRKNLNYVAEMLPKAIENMKNIETKIDSLNKSLEPLFKDFSSGALKPPRSEEGEKDVDLYGILGNVEIK